MNGIRFKQYFTVFLNAKCTVIFTQGEGDLTIFCSTIQWYSIIKTNIFTFCGLSLYSHLLALLRSPTDRSLLPNKSYPVILSKPHAPQGGIRYIALFVHSIAPNVQKRSGQPSELLPWKLNNRKYSKDKKLFLNFLLYFNLWFMLSFISSQCGIIY
jgi:hypothetical protein